MQVEDVDDSEEYYMQSSEIPIEYKDGKITEDFGETDDPARKRVPIDYSKFPQKWVKKMKEVRQKCRKNYEDNKNYCQEMKEKHW